MTEQQIYDWAMDFQKRNPKETNLAKVLEAFQEELMCILIKKICVKS